MGKRILITGNMGYIGPVLLKYLRDHYEGLYIAGFDAGYFAHCLSGARIFPETMLDCQYFGDLRQFPYDILTNDKIDTVIHLAAISNDPIGNRFSKVTEAINSHASYELAVEAKKRGVSRFVFASSCSLYGYAEGPPRREQDPLNPLTAYAKSKVFMEDALSSLAAADFIVTCLRFATACGMSQRVRLDLVLNDFVMNAILYKKILILSDGTPWRPLIHVKDMSRAIAWAMTRDAVKDGSGGAGEYVAVNTGSNDWNYQIKDLASYVADTLPEKIEIVINKDAQPDKRSYKVDFSLYESLAPQYLPQITIKEAIEELYEGLKPIAREFKDKDKFKDNGAGFRDSHYIRLRVLINGIENSLLTEDLYWKSG